LNFQGRRIRLPGELKGSSIQVLLTQGQSRFG
jgi:hypothetical protein